MHRWVYLFATYSGIRALVNRARCFNVRGVQVARSLHGVDFSSDDLGDLVIGVNSRGCPPSGDGTAAYGMISVRQKRPIISRLLYRYFCLTSHFGSGHVEIAFYEKGRRVTFYAVRNIARSNASRLGMKSTANKLLLAKRDEELQLMREIATLLRNREFVTEFASSDECVKLSVSSHLLRPADRERTLVSLKKMYDRVRRKIRKRAPADALILAPDLLRTDFGGGGQTKPINFARLIRRKIIPTTLFILVTAMIAGVAHLGDQLFGVVAYTYSYLAFCFITAAVLGFTWRRKFKHTSLLAALMVFGLLTSSFLSSPPSERLLRSAMLKAPPGTDADMIEAIVEQEYEGSSFVLPSLSKGSVGGYDRVHVSLFSQQARSCTALIFLIEEGRVVRSIFSAD